MLLFATIANLYKVVNILGMEISYVNYKGSIPMLIKEVNSKVQNLYQDVVQFKKASRLISQLNPKKISITSMRH